MFAAEQKYVPVSLPVTFDKSNCPLEPMEWSSCDWLSILLHATVGSGLPLTEHWNEAVPLSFTINFAGETETTGAVIDSPGSPLGHGTPAGPMSPFRPLSPGSSFGPTVPIIPCLPLSPGNPTRPLSPLFPGVPLSPVRPCSPFSPLGPGGPGGPGGPDWQESPFELQRRSVPADNSLFSSFKVSSGVLALLVVLVATTWRLLLCCSES